MAVATLAVVALVVVAAIVAVACGLVGWITTRRRRRGDGVPRAVLDPEDTERIVSGPASVMRRARDRMARGTTPQPLIFAQSVSGELVDRDPAERDLAVAVSTANEWPDLSARAREREPRADLADDPRFSICRAGGLRR